MNSLLEHIYTTGYVEDAEGNLIDPFLASVSYERGVLLSKLIKEKGLRNTLEIGMAYGLSTLFICQAHHDEGAGCHTAIDPNQDTYFKSVGLLNIKRAGLDTVLRFFQAPSYEVLPQLCTAGEHFDFAFVDGMHLFDYVLVDFFYIDRLLTVGGYIVLDDLWMPAIQKVAAFVLRNRSYKLVSLSSRKSIPLWKRAARIGRRIFYNPFERSYAGVRFITENVCILQKMADDDRPWNFYRSF